MWRDRDGGLTALRDAARRRPGDASAQCELGVACLAAGLPDEALGALQGAVAANPRLARVRLHLGAVLETLSDTHAALAAYRQAAALQPSLAEAHFRAGNLLALAGRSAEAAACFRRAASAGPKTALGRLGDARALLIEGRDDEAMRVLQRALAVDPGNAWASELLGTLLAEAGRFDEAAPRFDRAITEAPWLAGSFYELVRCRRVTPQDTELLARMEAALGGAPLAPAQHVRLHLALGKAADDLGDFSEAMRQFDAADAIRAELTRFDSGAFVAQTDAIIAVFQPERLHAIRALGDPSAVPVLVLGLPRSGTTLVEQILSSHPAVQAAGELGFWGDRVPLMLQRTPLLEQLAFVSATASAYLAALQAAPGMARVTDKMPLNFLWAGLIHAVFPQATIVHCRRTLIDTALSIHRTFFNPALPFPTGGPALVAFCRGYERLMDHWRRVLPPDRFVEVDYERLAAEPEPAIRRLLAACGLDWNEACLHPERNQRRVRTASLWQARQPIYRHAVGRWRDYEPWLGPLRALLS